MEDNNFKPGEGPGKDNKTPRKGGILIENVLRGNQWAYSVVGLGLN